MEDTHGARARRLIQHKRDGSLNPYYNGRYSWSLLISFTVFVDSCLNPYYNGRYSWRIKNILHKPKACRS